MKKLTFKYIYQYFVDNNCELLETEYMGAHTPMKYICSCGNISKINWTNFQQGKRCAKCGYEKNAESQKGDFEFIQQSFIDAACKLLETEYINNHTKMSYLCSCGNISKICWANFQQGYRCRKCGNEKISESKKLTFEFVQSEFQKTDCELLETEYVNNSTPMKYRCSCGNISKVRWGNFKYGKRCKKCQSSKGEQIIDEILKKYNIEFGTQKKFKSCKNKRQLPFDFHLPKHNLCIEFDGEQHFGPVKHFGGLEKFKKRQKHDFIKTVFCHEKGINLLRISYKEFDNIEEILKSVLKLEVVM